MANKDNTSPDVVKFEDVLYVITDSAKCFKSEKELGYLLARIKSLKKYDLKPVADTITETTVNVIAEDSKVRDFLVGIRNSLEKGRLHG